MMAGKFISPSTLSTKLADDIWKLYFNPPDADSGIFWDNKINDVAADALTPCVAKSSGGMVLTA